MSSIIFGIILVIGSAAVFWYFLPRNGQEHPLVRNSGVGSIITLTLMITFTTGLALLFEAFVG